MKAIEVTEYGGPEVMRLVDLPKPSAGPREVIVKLAFVGINFKDVYMRTGVYKDRPMGPSGIDYEPKFPFVLGLEGAGTVEELGAGVEDLALGDRVAFMEGIGAYAEYVAVPDWRVVKVPDAVSLELAAATQLQGSTAHYLCHAFTTLGPGSSCLAHAGAGGVGHILVQLAKNQGARVLTTVGNEEKAEFVRQLGADVIIPYREADGRDSCVDYIESAFGPTNIFCAADIWKVCQNFVKPWRKKLSPKQWMDVKYETLVRNPEQVLHEVCEFLGEEFSPDMLEFHKTDLAKARGETKDHKPLGHAVSDKYVGIYKDLLNQRDQRNFAAVAGKELVDEGYDLEVEPQEISDEDEALYREWDARVRAATLTAPEGHIVYESYNDWLVDQREERKKKGVWSEADIPNPPPFPIGDSNEEWIMGQRAWRQWKENLGVKRQYLGDTEL